jgi:hypothetical protein
MGMFDTVVVLNERLRCPHGHRVEGFQTKSFADPAMDTYLIEERQLWVEFRAAFDPTGQRHIERTSGTRDDLVTELRKDGLRAMRDDEPLGDLVERRLAPTGLMRAADAFCEGQDALYVEFVDGLAMVVDLSERQLLAELSRCRS